MADSNEPVFTILAPDEPDLDKMQSKILDMLQNGRSVNDIAISLRMDPQLVQGYADTFNKGKWQSMSRNDMRNEHIMMLNEMAELGKFQYMADPKPPHAFAVASIVKTANEIFRDMEANDNLDDLKEKVQYEVIQSMMESLVISLTKEIGQTRKLLAETLPQEKKAEAVRLLDDVAKALALHSKNVFEDSMKRLDKAFEENSSKQKSTPKKSNGQVSLVPHVDPRP